MTTTYAQPDVLSLTRFDTEVLLVRHGQSAPIPADAGSDNAPLSDAGQVQASALAERFAGGDLAGLYSSPLRRAFDTASRVAQACALAIQVEADLREVDLGEWSTGEFSRRVVAKDPAISTLIESGAWSAIPGGEASDSLQKRARTVLERVADHHRGASAMVVSHSGWINAALAHVWQAQRDFTVRVSNCSVTSLRTDGTTWIVTGVNDISHVAAITKGAPHAR